MELCGAEGSNRVLRVLRELNLDKTMNYGLRAEG